VSEEEAPESRRSQYAISPIGPFWIAGNHGGTISAANAGVEVIVGSVQKILRACLKTARPAARRVE